MNLLARVGTRRSGTALAVLLDEPFEEVVMENEVKTVAIKPCGACGAGLLEADKFCRWCGAAQIEATASAARRVSERSQEASRYVTSSLGESDLYHPFSGLLVKAVVGGVAGVCSPLHSSFARKVVQSLISIPIWLMIILLSPLDAYLSAKALTGRM